MGRACLIAWLLIAPPARPQEPAPKKLDHGEKCPQDCPPCDAAIERGFKHLIGLQRKDGGWEAPEGEIGSHDGVFDTALCGLALLAEGSTPRTGRYQEELRKCVGFLLRRIKPDGLLQAKSDLKSEWKEFQTWYVSFTALFLSEVYRKDPEAVPKEKLDALARPVRPPLPRPDSRDSAGGRRLSPERARPGGRALADGGGAPGPAPAARPPELPRRGQEVAQ